jgi:3-oxoacid CoA-transferase
LQRNKYFESQYLKGEVSLELVPQGTLVERMRAHAMGIPAFFTPTGADTAVETGGIPIRLGGDVNTVVIPGNKKETRVFNGKKHVMEPAIAGDVAFVHAWKADAVGNLVFRFVALIFYSNLVYETDHVYSYAANNFNGVMARNAKLTVVEAEEIVPVGALDPNEIHVPGIYVDRIVQAVEPKQIELLTLAKPEQPGLAAAAERESSGADIRHRIARRAAREMREGMYLNLGVGIPTLVTEHLPPGVNVWLESENGILGMGPFPVEGKQDPDIINAGKETVSLLPGASVFDSRSVLLFDPAVRNRC